MLVLSRKVGEKIKIGETIEVIVTRINENRVTIAIEAPTDVRILRGELSPKKPESAGDAAAVVS